MAFTKVVGAGIHTLSNITSHNINSSGIITATAFDGPFTGGSSSNITAGIITATELDLNGNVDISGNLTVQGTTTTLDTNLTGVDRVEVNANSDTHTAIVGIQSGTADIVNLLDGTTEVLTVTDGGNVGLGTATPSTGKLEIVHPTSTKLLTLKRTTGNTGEFSVQIGGADPGAIFDTSGISDDFIFRPGGTESVRFKGDKVGINSNPGAALEVNSGTSYDVAIFNSFHADGPLIPIQRSGTNIGFLGSGKNLAPASGGASDLALRSQANLIFTSGGGVEKLRIDDSGRMGLGVTPTGIFDIREDNNPQLTLRSTSHADNGGGRLNFAVGVAAAPVDGNTMCSIASTIHSTSGGTLKGDMKFYTNGGDDLEERLRITSGGNVNIGTGETTQTARMLNVYGGAARVTQTSGGNTIEAFGGTTSGQSYGLLVNAGSTSGDYCANFRNSSGTALLRIRGDGNVGINEDDPAYPLEVVGDGGGSFAASSNNTNGVLSIVGKNSSGGISAISRIKSYPEGSSNQSHMAFETRRSNNVMTEALRISATQQVGIGTTIPGQKLDVVGGNIRVGKTSNGQFIGENNSGSVKIKLDTDGVSYLNGGNVGIGTNAPDGKLHCWSATAGTVTADAGGDELVLESGGNTGLSILSPGSGESTIFFGNPGTNGQKDGYIRYYHETHSTEANRRSLVFITGGGDSERLRIDGSGRVKIGAAAVSQNRNLVIGSNAEANLAIETHNDAASESANIRFYKSRGTAESPTSVTDNHVISQLMFYGHDGNDYAHAAGFMRVKINGTPTTDQMPGEMSFHTNHGTTYATERLKIQANGRITMGEADFDAENDLHLKKANSGGDVSMRIGNDTVNDGSTASLYFTTSTTDNFNTAYIQAKRFGGKLNFGYATHDPTVTMHVSQALVGIGNTMPEGKGLDIKHDRTTAYAKTADQRDKAQLIIRNGSDAAGRFSSMSFVSGGGTQAEGSINMVQTGNYTGDFRFKLRAGGGSTDWRERFRITSSGIVHQSNETDELTWSRQTGRAQQGDGVSVTYTIKTFYWGIATFKIGLSDGNNKWAHFVVEIGGHQYTGGGQAYNATVVASDTGGGTSISTNQQDGGYHITIANGGNSNTLFGSWLLEGTSYSDGSTPTLVTS